MKMRVSYDFILRFPVGWAAAGVKVTKILRWMLPWLSSLLFSAQSRRVCIRGDLRDRDWGSVIDLWRPGLQFQVRQYVHKSEWMWLPATFVYIQAKLCQGNLLRMIRWSKWYCPPDAGFEIRSLTVWNRGRYLSVTEAPHNTESVRVRGKKHFFF